MFKNPDMKKGQLGEWFIAKANPPSVTSDRAGGTCVLPDRPLVSLAGGLLGAHVDPDRHAVDPERCITHFRAICRWNCRRSGCWRGDGYLFPRKRLGVWRSRLYY